MDKYNDIFKSFVRIVLTLLIACVACWVLTPNVKFLSTIIAFGMGISIGYLVVSWLRDKYTWLD